MVVKAYTTGNKININKPKNVSSVSRLSKYQSLSIQDVSTHICQVASPVHVKHKVTLHLTVNIKHINRKHATF